MVAVVVPVVLLVFVVSLLVAVLFYCKRYDTDFLMQLSITITIPVSVAAAVTMAMTMAMAMIVMIYMAPNSTNCPRCITILIYTFIYASVRLPVSHTQSTFSHLFSAAMHFKQFLNSLIPSK